MPADRLAALRRGFEQVVADPDFMAEFARQGIELDPMRGEDLQKLVDDVATVPPDLVAKVKANYGG